MWLTVVLDEEETVDPEIFSAKYSIVDWESQNLGNVDMEDLHVYKIIKENGNTSYHKSLFSMLRKFDRQDLVDLYKLVMKRFKENTLEGYKLMLLGDLKEMLEKMLTETKKVNSDIQCILSFSSLSSHHWKIEEVVSRDAKTLWEAIKTRFGGNKESKKIQKTILKQQYDNFTASRSEGLDKTYNRFEKLISQLEIHGKVISQEDANLKLL
ncbi:hypothetical protein Tco_1090257 [Tanacetum coccineum]|uniref:Uncharacterized protein n=1 Tax=Tanacetum coccineum TaxID=301880 RepID=A0ABQ5I4Y6_9ASTR